MSARRASIVKPIRRNLYVRKCTTGVKDHLGYMVGGVLVTDRRGKYNHWFEIIDIADDCKWFTRENVGTFVRLPEWHHQWMRAVVPTKTFMVDERIFEPYKDEKGRTRDSMAPAFVAIKES